MVRIQTREPQVSLSFRCTRSSQMLCSALRFRFRGRRTWPQARQSADPQVRRVGRLGKRTERKLIERKLRNQFWGTGGWGSKVTQWLIAALHFCCYLLRFLHPRPPRRPGAPNAPSGQVPCDEILLPELILGLNFGQRSHRKGLRNRVQRHLRTIP